MQNSNFAKNCVKNAQDLSMHSFAISCEAIIISNKSKNGYILYDSIYVKFSKRQKYSDVEQISHCQRQGLGEIVRLYEGIV